MADHLGLDLYNVEHLSAVDGNHGADHLGQDGHVTQVSLDGNGLVVGLSFPLLQIVAKLGLTYPQKTCAKNTHCLPELLQQGRVLASQTPIESSSQTSGQQLDDITVAHLQELVEIDAPVRKLLEDTGLLRSLLLHANITIKNMSAPQIVPKLPKKETNLVGHFNNYCSDKNRKGMTCKRRKHSLGQQMTTRWTASKACTTLKRAVQQPMGQ